MSLENKIAKALLEVGAVALKPNDPFTWASGIKSQYTVITVLRCHHLLFEKKLLRD